MRRRRAVYRFKGAALPGKVTTLVVKEESVRSERFVMASMDVSQLVLYSRTGEIPKNVRDALAKAIQLKQAVLDVEREINQRTQRIAEITQEQKPDSGEHENGRAIDAVLRPAPREAQRARVFN